MDYENFPKKEVVEERTIKNNNNGRNILTAVLVIALFGTWGYIIYDKSKTREKEDVLTAQVISGDSTKNQLQQELNDATLRLDALKTTNAQADSLIGTKNTEIQELQSKVQKILNDKNASASQLSEARRLIAQLKGNIETYTAEIETLKSKNTQLTQEKNLVTQQRDVMQKNYDSASQLIRQKEDVIDVASTLHASNFKITGIQEKSSGREKETSKAKKVDKIRITFDVDENRVTPSGTKDIYIAITSPDGKPVLVDALGSGKMVTRDNVERPFTKKIEINYIQGQKLPVSVEWSQNSDFQTGNYKIEIYNNGFKIGQGVVNFKKGGLFG
jgi:TolA-binding protein